MLTVVQWSDSIKIRNILELRDRWILTTSQFLPFKTRVRIRLRQNHIGLFFIRGHLLAFLLASFFWLTSGLTTNSWLGQQIVHLLVCKMHDYIDDCHYF
jgi:hypothetical protein